MKRICNKCNKKSLNPYICDYCEMPMNYDETSNWKENVLIEEDKKESFKIELNKNTVISGSILIIALSIAFSVYNDYRERKQIEKLTNVYVNALGNVGIQTIDAQKKIEESFKDLKNFKF